MIMSSSQVRESISNGGPEIRVERKVEVDSYPPILNCITNVGLDVTLGVEDGRAYDLTAQRHLEYQCIRGGGRYLMIEPGHTVSVQTSETITLGPRTAALVESKVRLVSRGVSHVSTTIDPCWSGPLMLTFTYFGKRKLRISAGDAIATIVFLETDSEVHASPEASPKNNAVRWAEYDQEQAEAKRARVITIALFVSVFAIALVFWFWPFAITVWREAFDEKTQLGSLAKDLLGGTARQRIEFLTWLVVLVTATSTVLNYFGRRVFLAIRRGLGGTTTVPRDGNRQN